VRCGNGASLPLTYESVPFCVWNNSPGAAEHCCRRRRRRCWWCRQWDAVWPDCRNAVAAIWASKQLSGRRDGGNEDWRDRTLSSPAAAAATAATATSFYRLIVVMSEGSAN